MTRIFILLIATLLPSSFALAQASEETAQMSSTETLLLVTIGFVIVVSIIVLLVAIYSLYAIRTILLEEKIKKAREEGQELVPEEGIFRKVSQSIWKSKPVDQEKDIIFEHDYDGIRELDNFLPPWWKWLFFITIGWSAVYLLVFHVFKTAPSTTQEYDIQIAQAEEQIAARKALLAESIDESNVVFTDEDNALNNGIAIYKQHCVACHAADGGGGVGPNLTDNYWIHGGDIKSIFSVIKYGVPQKGMISWQTQLKPTDMRDVASYIQTLVGTTPANPKEPQGELYQPESTPAETPANEGQVTKPQGTETIALR